MHRRERRTRGEPVGFVRAVRDRQRRARRHCARGRGRASCRRSSAWRPRPTSSVVHQRAAACPDAASESLRRRSGSRGSARQARLVAARDRGPRASCRSRPEQEPCGVERRRAGRRAVEQRDRGVARRGSDGGSAPTSWRCSASVRPGATCAQRVGQAEPDHVARGRRGRGSAARRRRRRGESPRRSSPSSRRASRPSRRRSAGTAAARARSSGRAPSEPTYGRGRAAAAT